ncbi:hypothetical protein [Halothermothrix orenii]|uniref:hypothetical protein n=1 Tax=Halothermothrix orenii TaxID=31909 RepID=UPI00059FAEE6|nr:hypothetical protein [Halothermothrix orenii]
MNKKFMAGLLLGSLIGITIATVSGRVVKEKVMIGFKDENKDQGGSGGGVQKVDSEKKGQGKYVGPGERGNEKKEEMVRNPEEEVQKKAGQEEAYVADQMLSKLNFGKKISQLEEALKNLREDNT